MPIFCQKNIHSPRFCALMSFFRIFMKKPLLLYHTWSKKLKKLLRFLFLSGKIENTEKVSLPNSTFTRRGGAWGCKKGRVFKSIERQVFTLNIKSLVIVRSTTGGSIFVSPNKPRGDVTDVTDVSNVTVWSTRFHGGP